MMNFKTVNRNIRTVHRKLGPYLFLSMLCVFTTFSFAQDFTQTITQCPASSIELKGVDFTSDDCTTTSLSNFTMKTKSVWVSFTMEVPQKLLQNKSPIGLFLSGNMNARVYLAGSEIGNKGIPSLSKEEEIIGPFDWVAYVPLTLLQNIFEQQKDTSSLVVNMHLSSFHSHGEINYIFNKLYFDEYQNSTQKQFSNYGFSLIPMGIMLVGLIFLLCQKSIRRLESPVSKFPDNRYLLLMTFVAICQLFVEMSRGLFAYDYPIHHLRLQAILILALVFGHLLLLQAIKPFKKFKASITLIASLCVVFLVHVFIVGQNQDLRATSSMQIPAFIAAVLIFLGTRDQGKLAQLPAWVLILFCILIYFFPYDFLDVYLYYCMALLLIFMLSYYAYIQSQLQVVLSNERERANKLQLAIDLKGNASSKTISLKDSGKVIICPVDDIFYCKGAGDYVEVLTNEKTILHSGSLNAMIGILPTHFIKVHRSYVVNAKYISQLARLPSGTGEITLSNLHKIPVSRRLLPKLKLSFKVP